MAFRASVMLLERLTPTGLRGIKVPPRGSKERWNARIIDVTDYDDYRHQLHKIKCAKGSLGVTFFMSENSEKCLEMDDIVYKITQANNEVTFLRLNVKEPGVGEIMEKLDVPLMPTFYFYKGGDIVGRMIGTSASKLEDLVVSFIHHRELRYHIRLNEF